MLLTSAVKNQFSQRGENDREEKFYRAYEQREFCQHYGWRPYHCLPAANCLDDKNAKSNLEKDKDIAMRINEIMSKDVLVVLPDALLNEVAKKMRQNDCGSILVAKDDRLLGVITDRDLALRCVAESHHPAETTAAQVMTAEILYCRDTDELEDVALNMTTNKVRRLPVLDKDKRLVGIVSLGDLAVHSTDHIICGRALGFICATPGHVMKPESGASEINKRSFAAN